jgi:hypothetical protein
MINALFVGNLSPSFPPRHLRNRAPYIHQLNAVHQIK